MDVENNGELAVASVEEPKTIFVNDGSRWFCRSPRNMVSTVKLPPGLYTVMCHNPVNGEFYLEEGEGFKLPDKVYGTVMKDATRILDTYRSRGRGTGVLLNGVKGSGKTLTAKAICLLAMNEGIPCVAVNRPFTGEAFFGFVMALGKCILYFDEFEKVYREKEAQESILTLLDGVYNSDKMYLLTTNDSFGLVDPLQNRPGRIYYLLNYDGVSNEFIREYCEDNLEDKGQIDKMMTLGNVFQKFNFDMLQAIVEEVNRYGEGVSEALKWLNIRPAQYDFKADYNISIKSRTEQELVMSRENPTLTGYSLPTQHFYVTYDNLSLKEKEPDYWADREVPCNLDTLVLANMKDGIFIYEYEVDGIQVTATRVEHYKQKLKDPYYGMLA